MLLTCFSDHMPLCMSSHNFEIKEQNQFSLPTKVSEDQEMDALTLKFEMSLLLGNFVSMRSFVPHSLYIK